MGAETLLANELGLDDVSLLNLRACRFGPVSLKLTDDDWARVDNSFNTVQAVIKEGRTVYGVNTGFGVLASTSIPTDKLEELQRNIVLSHAAGVGDRLADEVVRLVMVLKAASLSRGHSGVQRATIETLQAFIEHDILPVIPAKGSVGASGDLAPLSAMACAMIGEGDVIYKGKQQPAKAALDAIGRAPLVLGPKEGLALLNGTQVSNALALTALYKIEDVFAAAMVAGMLSVDAAEGSDTPFDARIHAVRGQIGQMDVAKHYRQLIEGSGIRASHEACERVQDPYCLRCQPQVMGAALDFIHHAATILEREACAVSDNPLVFPDEGDILSGGNFHAEPVAMAADTLAIALAEVGSMSERRVSLLMDSNLSKLPPFLVKESGINSGFMIAQVTAAALVSENKQMSHPASVDSIPTSANQEDHVSMATHAARRLLDMADNAAHVVAIELLAAAQGIEFRRPRKSSPVLEKVHAMVRERVPAFDHDRTLTPDIESIQDLVLSGVFRGFVKGLLPSDQ